MKSSLALAAFLARPSPRRWPERSRTPADGDHHRRFKAGRRLLTRWRACSPAICRRHIPGKPTVIVQEHAGRQQHHRRHHMYSVAKPDGLTPRHLQPQPAAIAAAHQGRRGQVRHLQFAWIGSVATRPPSSRAQRPGGQDLRRLRKRKQPVVAVDRAGREYL